MGMVLALLATMLLPPAPVAQAASATGQEPVLSSSTSLTMNSAEGPAGLHQFTAGGHVLGFQPDGVYVVGSDRMLKVTFAGATGVAPVADQPPSSDGLAQPLGQVTYPHLWDGISLTYQQVTGGIAKSSYLLDPGAAVDQIRLCYNVPVQVDAGGKLLFGFETGQISESAPVAWQEIAGQRAPVAVSFRLLAEREVSFALGEYDPAYPLVIDPTLQWNTFMGSSNDDDGLGIAVDGSGNVYVAGYNDATWGSPVNPFAAGGSDAFAAKLGPLSISKTADPNTDVTYHGEVTYTVVLNNSDVFSATGTLLTDTLPISTTFARWVEQPGGASVDPGPPEEITWSGPVSASTAITFTFVVTHVGNYGDVVTNTAEYSHTTGSGSDDAAFTVESIIPTYLPIILKGT